MHIDEIDRIDTRLAFLGRGVGAMRLRIGEGLLRLEAQGGLHALGFPSVDSYAREALGRSGRWAADARALARRLAELPHLRAALVSGRLATSKVELVARVATADDDAAWVECASRMTVRALRVELASSRAAALEDDTAAPRATITATVDRVEALAFERTRLLVEALGATRGDAVVEAILAEGLGELLATHADVDLPSGLCGGSGDTRAERAELVLLREQRELAGESLAAPDVAPLDALAETAPIDGDVATIDRGLRAAARDLAGRDLELAALARRALDHELWRALGFVSFDHYVRERVGLSPASVASRVALARRCEALPEVEGALAGGRIGFEAASLVARVAGCATVTAWLGRAEARTVRHLREEVEAVELVARVEGRDVRRLGPPEPEALGEIQDVERAALSIVAGRGQMSGGQMSGGQMSGDQMSGAELPKTTLTLALSDDIAGFWRSLERLHRQLEGEREASFVAFLVRAVTRSWSDVLPAVAYAHIYQRDRWRCACPVCRSKHVTPHHIPFRSHGGGDEAGNVVSLCEVCHMSLVHLGRLRVSGDAEHVMTWRAAGWAVDGRRRLAA